MKTISEIVEEVASYHGCMSGDCLHSKGENCYKTLIRAGAEAYRDEVAKRFPKGEEAQWRDCVIADLKSLQEKINAAEIWSLFAGMLAVGALAIAVMKGG